MRRLAALVVVAGALAAPAGASAAKVDLLVVGKGGAVLRGPKAVTPKAATVEVGGRRCAVAAQTPLASLLRGGLKTTLRDYGSCGKRTADSANLFVSAVAGQKARGTDGWVYKVGGKVPSRGAAAPGARIKRAGTDLLWFWCVSGAKGCQRTLEVEVDTDVAAAGQPFDVTVRGLDDRGKAKPVPGATVTAGGATAVSGADGRATLTAPAQPGSLSITATAPGLVPSFPAEVDVS